MIRDTKVKKRMPNFLIAGVQRGGTTSINRMLNQHPDLYIPRREVHFFDKHYHKGLDWYKRHFAGVKGGLCGEKTPEYIYFEECLQRIQKHRPEMKFIVSLRNPIERAISYYKASRPLRDMHPLPACCQGISFAKKVHTLKNYSHFHFVKRGIYYNQLQIFKRYFNMDQLHIIIFEKFKKQSAIEMRKVFDFLEVKRVKVNKVKINSTKKNALIENVLRNQLADYYKEHNQKLFDSLGYKIDEW